MSKLGIGVGVVVDVGLLHTGEPLLDFKPLSREAFPHFFHHLGRATRWTYDAFTPGNALGAAEWLLFDGDPQEWWNQLPYTMGDDTQAAEAITPLQISW